MNKRLLSFVVLICIVTICAMGLIACAGEDGTPGNPQQLAAPTITLDGDTATWEANPKASGYEISVNGSILKVSATVTSRQLIEGVTIKVRAVGDGTSYLTSEWSNTVTYNAQVNEGTTKDVNFVMINDTHGAFTDSAEGYSIGRVDTLISSLEGQKGDQIFIHNGDAFQGSYVCGETYGYAMIEALNAMDLDCFVIGNHEFDWGIDKIARYADGDQSNGEADFPFLGANIYLKGTTTRPDWIDAYHVVEQDGVKVGIIGIMGDDQESSILTRYVKDYDFVPPISIISSTASYLRTEVGCDVVVVATHDYNEGINESIASLAGPNAIDAIFCAHTHQNISEFLTRSDFKKIPAVQCYHKNNSLKEVVLKVSESGAYRSATIDEHAPSEYAISARVQTVINKYQDVIADSQKVLSTTQYGLSSATLGGYATDLMLNNDYAGYNFGEVDVSIINTGGVRAEIDAGEITKAEVFEVFPFNNAVVLVNISGALIKSICSQNTNYLYYQVSSEAGGSYYALNDNTIYQLAVIDYVFENTRYDQFDNISSSNYVETDILLRNLLLEYFDESTEDDDVTPPDDGGGDVTPPAETIETVTISEFYADFNSYTSTAVKVSGVAYSCDKYGIFIKDGTGNLYLKTSYTGLYMGQTITATGTANAYYSMPQMMVTEPVYGATGGSYSVPSSVTTIAQIIADNSSQSDMVYDHKVYRTRGVLTQDGDYYNLVDGTNKIQIKSSMMQDDYNTIISYVNKEIELNIVIGDCFTTTGIFRFVSLRERLNLVEVDEEEPEEPDVPVEPEDPNAEPARIETTIAALVANVPELDQAVIYVTTATWILENASNATTYGNGWLRDSLGNEVEVYGLCSSDSVVSWGDGFYDYSNNRSYASSGIADGDTVKVGMLYSLPYDNYKCFLIEIINDDDEPAGVQNAGVNFVMINDTHGALLDSSEGYSLGRVDTLITALKNSKGDQIFIHNGDAFQGSYVVGENYGLSMIEAFNAMELDCFVLGNHEFDWGLDKIAQYADGNTANGEANFPFLGANIYYAGTTTRPEWIKAYHIVEQDGVKIGIIGIMEDGNEDSILTSLVSAYDFVAPLSIIQSTAADLRNNQGCDVVVVATHGYQESFNTSVAQLSGNSKIDAIFCAHTHQNIGYYETRSDSKQIPVVQCLHKNNNLAEVILNVDTDGSYVDATYSKYSPGNYSISTRVQTVINKYQDVIDDGNSVIGSVSGGLSESELGAHATDAMLNYNYTNNTFGDIDITIINTGGVRAPIDDGNITKAEVYEVFPFNNVVVIVNMSGALLKSLYGGNSKYLYMDIDDSIGSYTNLDDDTIYQLAVVDYVFEGKYYDEFKTLDSDDYYYSDVIMRNLLIEHLDATY